MTTEKNKPIGAGTDVVRLDRKELTAGKGSTSKKKARSRGSGKRKKPAVERLVSAASAVAYLFSDQRTSRPYVALPVRGGPGRRTVPLEGGAPRRWLAQVARSAGITPTGDTLGAALACLQADALADSAPRHNLDLRFVRHGEDLLLDLGDPGWTMIRVTRLGWRPEPHAGPPRFWRPGTLRPLAQPDPSAQASDLPTELRALLGTSPGVTDLLAAWLPAILVADAPRYGLLVTGPEGSGKSTVARVVAGIVDAKDPPFRRVSSRDPRELAIAAERAAVIVVDNLSTLSQTLSDDLCGVISGAGATFRTLFSNRDEEAYSYRRALVLTGITVRGACSDLQDRMLDIQMPLRAAGFHSERELWARVSKAGPRLLGTVLDAAVRMLALLGAVEAKHATRLGTLRMRDAGAYMAAAGEGIGIGAGRVLDLLVERRTEARRGSLEAEPVGVAVHAFMDGRPDWAGTIGSLADAVRPADPPKDWPKSARGFSAALRRCVATLAGLGVEVKIGKHGRSGREVTLAALAAPGTAGPSQPAHGHDPQTAGASGGDAAVTDAEPEAATRATSHSTLTETSRKKPNDHNRSDGGDGRDGVPGDLG